MKKMLMFFSIAGLTFAVMKRTGPEKIGKGTFKTVDPPGGKPSFDEWCKHVGMSRQWASDNGQISTVVNLSEEKKTTNII